MVDGSLVSTLPLGAVQATLYGPSRPTIFSQVSIEQDNYWYWNFSVHDAVFLDIILEGTAEDLDLFLYRDGADGSTPDGAFVEDEIILSSESSSSNEDIQQSFPENGFYQVKVYGFNVTQPNATFTLTRNLVEGKLASYQPTAVSSFNANQEVPFSFTGNYPLVGEYSHVLVVESDQLDGEKFTFPISVFRYVPGDSNYNSTFESLDLINLAMNWFTNDNFPLPVDVNKDGKVQAKDLLALLKLMN
jgi:hypothetical protein